jgi:UDP-N-acetylmuramate-alanine ligase
MTIQDAAAGEVATEQAPVLYTAVLQQLLMHTHTPSSRHVCALPGTHGKTTTLRHVD